MSHSNCAEKIINSCYNSENNQGTKETYSNL